MKGFTFGGIIQGQSVLTDSAPFILSGEFCMTKKQVYELKKITGYKPPRRETTLKSLIKRMRKL